MKSFAVAIVLLFTSAFVANVSSQVILEVPGYAVINGTNETSTYTERPFYAFRSVYYAEKPSPENRFLVSSRSKYIYLGNFTAIFVIATHSKSPVSHGRSSTDNTQQCRMSSTACWRRRLPIFERLHAPGR